MENNNRKPKEYISISFNLYTVFSDLIKSMWVILALSVSVACFSYMYDVESYQPSYTVRGTYIVTARGINNDLITAMNLSQESATRFAEIINSLNFTSVEVLDPHSYVSEALIDRIKIVTPKEIIQKVLDEIGGDVVMFYPDEGAVKRYSTLFVNDFVFGMKHRDTKTRKIDNFSISGDTEAVKGKKVLMIDDICATGSTLSLAAGELKKIGAEELYVFVSHCEETILEGNLLDAITRLYTTDSIFRSAHPKIRVMNS